MIRFLSPAPILRFLILLDAVISVWALGLPKVWFWIFYGQAYTDTQGLLHRCGANWAAFLVLQCIALWRFRKEPMWLAVVAGCRLADVPTDLTVLLAADHLTWIGKLTFALAGPANLIFGIALLSALTAHAQRSGGQGFLATQGAQQRPKPAQ